MSTLQVAKHLHEVGATPEGELTMRYEEGGRIEVWSDARRSVRTRAGAGEQEVAAAFAEATS